MIARGRRVSLKCKYVPLIGSHYEMHADQIRAVQLVIAVSCADTTPWPSGLTDRTPVCARFDSGRPACIHDAETNVPSADCSLEAGGSGKRSGLVDADRGLCKRGSGTDGVNNPTLRRDRCTQVGNVLVCVARPELKASIVRVRCGKSGLRSWGAV